MHHYSNRYGKPIGCHTKYLLLIICMVALADTASGFWAEKNKANRMSETELQTELMAFAERLVSYLYQGLQNFERAPGALEMRPVVQKDVVTASMSAMTIAADSKPDRALLDMLIARS